MLLSTRRGALWSILVLKFLQLASATWFSDVRDHGGEVGMRVKWAWKAGHDPNRTTDVECRGQAIDALRHWDPQFVPVSAVEVWAVFAGCGSLDLTCHAADPISLTNDPQSRRVDMEPYFDVGPNATSGAVCGASQPPFVVIVQIRDGSVQAIERYNVSELGTQENGLPSVDGARTAGELVGPIRGYSATRGIGGGVAVLVITRGYGTPSGPVRDPDEGVGRGSTIVFVARPLYSPADEDDERDPSRSLELFTRTVWHGVETCATVVTAGGAASQSYVVTCVGGFPLRVGGHVGMVTTDGAVGKLHSRAIFGSGGDAHDGYTQAQQHDTMDSATSAMRDDVRKAAAAAVETNRVAAAASPDDVVAFVRVDAFGTATSVGIAGYMRGAAEGWGTPVWTCAADDDTAGRADGVGVWAAVADASGDVTVVHIGVPLVSGGASHATLFEDNVAPGAIAGVRAVADLACGGGDGLVVWYHGLATDVGLGDEVLPPVQTRCWVEGLRGLVCDASGHDSTEPTAPSDEWMDEDEVADAARGADSATPGESGPDSGYNDDHWAESPGGVYVRQPAASRSRRRHALVQQVGGPWGEVIRLTPDTNAAGDACVWMAIAGSRVRQLGAVAPFISAGGGTGQLLVAHACPVVALQTFSGAFEIDFNGRRVEHHKDVMPLKVTRARDLWVSGNAFSSMSYVAGTRRYTTSLVDRPCAYMFRLAPVTARVLAHRIICSQRLTENGFRGVNVSAAANHGMNGLVLALNPHTPTFRLDGRVIRGWSMGRGRSNYSVLVSFDEDANVMEMRPIVPLLGGTSTALPGVVVSHIAERLVEETGVGRFSGYDYMACIRFFVVVGSVSGIAFPGNRLDPTLSTFANGLMTFRSDLVTEIYRSSVSTNRFEVADIVPRATGGWSVCANVSGSISISGITSSNITQRVSAVATEEVYYHMLHNFNGFFGTRIGAINQSAVCACAGLGDGSLVSVAVVNSTYMIDGVANELPEGVTQLAMFRRLSPTFTATEHIPLGVANAGAITTARAVAVLSDGRVLVGGRVTIGGAVKLTGDAGAYAQLAFMDPSPESVGMRTATQYAAAVVRAIHPPRASVLRIVRDTLSGYWAAMSGMGISNEMTPGTVTNFARQLIIMRFTASHVSVAGLSLQWPTDPLPNSGSGGDLWGLAPDGFGGVWVGGTRSGTTPWTCGSTALAGLGGATDVFVFRLTLRATMAFCAEVGTASADRLYAIVPQQSASAVVLMGTAATSVVLGGLGPDAGSATGTETVGALLSLSQDGTPLAQRVIRGGSRDVRIYGGTFVCGIDSLAVPELYVVAALTGSGAIVSASLNVPVSSSGAMAQLLFRSNGLTPVAGVLLTSGAIVADDVHATARVAWGAVDGALLLCTMTQGVLSSTATPPSGTAGTHNVVIMRARDGRVAWHVTIPGVYTGGTRSVNASVDCDEDGAGGVWVVYTYDRDHTVRGSVKTTLYTATPGAVSSALIYVDSKGRIMYHTSYAPTPTATPEPVRGLQMRTIRMLPSCTFIIGGWMADTNIDHPEARRWTAPWTPTAPEHGLLMAMAIPACAPLNLSLDVCEFARPVMSMSISRMVIYDVQRDATELFWVRMSEAYNWLLKGVLVRRYSLDGVEFATASISYSYDHPNNMTWTVDGIGGVWLYVEGNTYYDPHSYGCTNLGSSSTSVTFWCHFDGRGHRIAASTRSWDHSYPLDAYLSSMAPYLNGGCIMAVTNVRSEGFSPFVSSSSQRTSMVIAFSSNGTTVAAYRFPRGSSDSDQLTNVQVVSRPTAPGALAPQWVAVGQLGGRNVHSFTLGGKSVSSTSNYVSIYAVPLNADLNPTDIFEVARSSTFVSVPRFGVTRDRVLVPIWTQGTVYVGAQTLAAVTAGRSLTVSIDLATGSAFAAPQYFLSGSDSVNITSVGTDSAGDGYWVSGTTRNRHFEMFGHTFGTNTHTSTDSRVLMYVDPSGSPVYRMPMGSEGNTAVSSSHINVSAAVNLGRCRIGVTYNASYPNNVPMINLTHGAMSPTRLSSSNPSAFAILERQVGCDPQKDPSPYDAYSVYASMRTELGIDGAIGAATVRIVQFAKDGTGTIWALALASEVAKFGAVDVRPFQRQLILAHLDLRNMFIRTAMAVERTSDGPFLLQADDVGGVWLAGAISAPMQFGGGAALAPTGGVDIAVVHYTVTLSVLASGMISGPGAETPTSLLTSVSPTAAVGTAVMIAFTTTTTTSVSVTGSVVSMAAVGSPGQANSLIVEVHHGKRDDTACQLEHTGTRLVIPSVATGPSTVVAMTTSCANQNMAKDFRVGQLGNLLIAVVAVRGAITTVSPQVKARGTYLLRIDGHLKVSAVAHIFDTPVDSAKITPDGVSGQWVCTPLYFPLRSAFGAIPVPYAGDDYCVRTDIRLRAVAHNRANAPLGGMWLKAIDGDGEGGVWTLSGYHSNVDMMRGLTTVPNGRYVNVLTHIAADGTVRYATAFDTRAVDGLRIDALAMLPVCDVLVGGHNGGAVGFPFGMAGDVAPGTAMFGTLRDMTCNRLASTGRSTLACPLWFPTAAMSTHTLNFGTWDTTVLGVVPISSAGGFFALMRYSTVFAFYGLRLRTRQPNGYALIRFDMASQPRRARTIIARTLVMASDDMDGIWMAYSTSLSTADAPPQTIQFGDTPMHVTTRAVVATRLSVDFEVLYQGVIANASAYTLAIHSRRDGSGGLIVGFSSADATIQAGAFTSTRLTIGVNDRDAVVLATMGSGYVEWGDRMYQLSGGMQISSVCSTVTRGGMLAVAYSSSSVYSNFDGGLVTTRYYTYSIFKFTYGERPVYIIDGQSNGILIPTTAGGVWSLMPSSTWARLSYFDSEFRLRHSINLHEYRISKSMASSDGDGGIWIANEISASYLPQYGPGVAGSRVMTCGITRQNCVILHHINVNGVVDFADDLLPYLSSNEEPGPGEHTWWNDGQMHTPIVVPIGGTCGVALFFTSTLAHFVDFGLPNGPTPPNGTAIRTYVASYHTSTDRTKCSGAALYANSRAAHTCSGLPLAPAPPVLPVALSPPPVPIVPPPLPFAPVPTAPMHAPKSPVPVAPTPLDAPAPHRPTYAVGGWGHYQGGVVPMPVAPVTPLSPIPQWPAVIAQHSGLGAMTLHLVVEDRLGGLWCVVGAASVSSFLSVSVTSAALQWIVARVNFGFTLATSARAVATTAAMPVTQVRGLVPDGYGGVWVVASTSGTGSINMGGTAIALPTMYGGAIMARYSYALEHMVSKLVLTGVANPITGVASYGGGGVVMSSAASVSLPMSLNANCVVSAGPTGLVWMVAAFDADINCRRVRLFAGTIYGIASDSAPGDAGGLDEYVALVGYRAGLSENLGTVHGVVGPSASYLIRIADAAGMPVRFAGVVTRMPGFSGSVHMALDGVGGVWIGYAHASAYVHLRDRSEELPYVKSFVLQRHSSMTFVLQAFLHVGLETSGDVRAVMGDGSGGVWLVGEATGAVSVMPARLAWPSVAARRPIILHAASYRLFDSGYVALTTGSGSAWATGLYPYTAPTFVEVGCRLAFGVQSDPALQVRYPKAVGETSPSAGASVLEITDDTNACKDTAVPRVAVGDFIPSDFVALTAPAVLAMKSTSDGGWIVALRVDSATAASYLGVAYPSGGSGSELLMTMYAPTGAARCTFLLGFQGGTAATIGSFASISPRRDGTTWVALHATPTDGTSRIGNIATLSSHVTVSGGNSVAMCVSATCTSLLFLTTPASVTAIVNGPEDQLLLACHSTTATTVLTHAVPANHMVVLDISLVGIVTRTLTYAANDARLVSSMFIDCHTMTLYLAGISGTAHATNIPGTVGSISLQASRVYVVRVWLEDFLSKGHWVSAFAAEDPRIAPRAGGVWVTALVTGSVTHASVTHPAIGTKDVMVIALGATFANVGAVRVGATSVTITNVRAVEEEVTGGVMVSIAQSVTTPAVVRDGSSFKRAFLASGGATVFVVVNAAVPRLEHVVPLSTSGSFVSLLAVSSACNVIVGGTIDRVPTGSHPPGALPVVRVGSRIRRDLAAADNSFLAVIRTRDHRCGNPQYRAAFCALRPPPVPNECPKSLGMSVDAGVLVESPVIPPVVGWAHGDIRPGTRFQSHNCLDFPQYSGPPSIAMPADGKSIYFKSRAPVAGAQWCTAVSGDGNYVAVGERGLVDIYHIDPFTRKVGLEVRLRASSAVAVSAKTHFGAAVMLRGGVLVAGAPADDSAVTNDVSGPTSTLANVGSAFVYEQTGTVGPQTFSEVAIVRHPLHAHAGLFFGFSVAVSIDGSVIVVGAPGDAYGYTTATGVVAAPFGKVADAAGSGSVAVFVRAFAGTQLGGGLWYSAGLVREPLSSIGADRGFGSAVAVDGQWPVYVILTSAAPVGHVQVNVVTVGNFMQQITAVGGAAPLTLTPPSPYDSTQNVQFGASVALVCTSATACLMAIGTPNDDFCAVGPVAIGTAYSGGCPTRGGVWVATLDVTTRAVAYEILMKPPAAVPSLFGAAVRVRCDAAACHFAVGAPTDSLAGSGRITMFTPGAIPSGTGYTFKRTTGPTAFSWERIARPIHAGDRMPDVGLGSAVDAVLVAGTTYRAAFCAPRAGNALPGVNQLVYQGGAPESGALYLEEYP